MDANTYTEEDVRIMLIGDSAELGQGLELVHAKYAEKICGTLKYKFPGLKREDWEDAWQNTMVALVKKVQAGGFDAERPLEPWLWEVARARAVDISRKYRTRAKHADKLLDDLKDTELFRAVNGLDEAQKDELRELIRKAIVLLPEKQRIVMQTSISSEEMSHKKLAEEVSRITGKQETVAAVKRALQEGRRKVWEALDKILGEGGRT